VGRVATTMTIGVGHTVILTDADAVQVSPARAERIALELKSTLLRQLPGLDHRDAEAAARNIAAMYGELGISDAAPHAVDPEAVTLPIDLDEFVSQR